MFALRTYRMASARRILVAGAALALLALSGCVAYPAYGPGPYGGGYYAPGYSYAPPVVVGGGWWGGGYRGRSW